MKSSAYYIFLILILGGTLAAFIAVRNHHNKANNVKEELQEEYGIERGSDLFSNYMVGSNLPQSAFISDMIEAYNAYMLYHGFQSVRDIWYRYEAPEIVLEMLQYANVNVLKYKDLKLLISQAIDLEKSALCVSYDEADSILHWQLHQQLSAIDSTLANRFHVSNYVSLSEDDYWAAINYDKTTEYTKNHLDAIRKTNDFKLKCDHAMAYVYDIGFYNVDYGVLEELLDDGRYSPQLFFLWRIWRCGMQLNTYGASSWSDIPNGLYNAKRLQIAKSILNHIIENPDDAIAINQYLVTAGQTNILRRGDFTMGNQAFMEVYYLNLMPDKDIDNDSENN